MKISLISPSDPPFDKNVFVVDPDSRAQAIQLLSLPGAYRAKAAMGKPVRPVNLPGTTTHWRFLMYISGGDYEIYDSDLSSVTMLLSREDDRRSRMESLMTGNTRTNETYANKYGLYQYQAADALAVMNTTGMILANEQGLGKTRSVLAAIDDSSTIGHSLIVTPTSMVAGWAAEAAKLPGFSRRVVVLTGGSKKAGETFEEEMKSGAKIFVISYDLAKKLTQKAAYGSKRVGEPGPLNLCKFNFVVLDEAHRIRNPDTIQSRAMWKLGEQARYRVAITGTPVDRHREELWSLFRFIQPHLFPSRSKFVDTFFNTYEAPWGVKEVCGVKDGMKHAWDQLTSSHIRRITKEKASLHLPPKRHNTIQVEMSPKQRKQYNMMKKEFMVIDADGGVASVIHPIASLSRLTQLANGEMLIQDGQWIKYTASPKVDWLLDYVDGMGPDQKIVVMAHSKKLLMYAAQRLRAEKSSTFLTTLVTGDTHPADRDTEIELFQKSPYHRVFLGTIAACKEGITLTAADTMIFLDQSWSNIEMTQVRDRIHRIGSERHESIQYITLRAAGTIEQHQEDLMRLKESELRRLFMNPAKLERYMNG